MTLSMKGVPGFRNQETNDENVGMQQESEGCALICSEGVGVAA